jgi:hypothetical protein
LQKTPFRHYAFRKHLSNVTLADILINGYITPNIAHKTEDTYKADKTNYALTVKNFRNTALCKKYDCESYLKKCNKHETNLISLFSP